MYAARTRLRRAAIVVGALVLIGVILWLDVSSQFWNDLVILAGLAAGLVTFLFTALVINRALERSTERRWAPVNRLALSAFLHAVADEERSEISRGLIVPRSFPGLIGGVSGSELDAELERLRVQVVAERADLTLAVSQWSAFLASSGDYADVLSQIAEIGLRLDRLRDAALDAERARDHRSRTALELEIEAANAGFSALVEELQSRLARLAA